MPESLRDACNGGRRLVGTVLTLPGVGTAELLAEPFDLVWVDLEHGALGLGDAQDLIIGAQAAGAYALARLPADAGGLIAPVLDAGVDGVVVADVRDPATAAAVGDRLVHPPDGSRGYGPRRASSRGRTCAADRGRPVLWAQIESGEGVAGAAEIAAQEAVDALVVGTADLSFALGVPLQHDSPQLAGAVRAVREACGTAAHFGVAGALTAPPAALLEGAAFLVHSTDARLCADAVDRAARWMRDVLDRDDQEHS